MAKFSCYAVRKGRITGLYNTWAECEAQVKGFMGAEYKGFANVGEATSWLWGDKKNAPAAGRAEVPPAARAPKAEEVVRTKGRDCDYVVYTDGSCLRNPDGPGGYAAVLLKQTDGSSRELCGGEPSTTNNRMELRAAIEALRELPKDARIQLNTDSRYLRDAIEKYWLRAWKKRGWITSTGTPVKNRDLWEALDAELSSRHGRIVFCWVKGHAGQKYNERCDALARGEAMKYAGKG